MTEAGMGRLCKVKPLVWKHTDFGSAWAKSDLGLLYEARLDGSWLHRNGDVEMAGSTLDDAKAAAQADFEQRVLSALAPAIASLAEREACGWRLLQNGEVIEAGDQVLADDTVTWQPLKGWEIGLPYYSGVYVPARRAITNLG